jgi:hypothetical protein
MSLLDVRRERMNQGFGKPKQPMKAWQLAVALIVVIWLIWYLGRAG